MSGLFITATGTDSGKTFVTAALAHQLRQAGRRVRALKPVLSGFDPRETTSDAHVLMAALGETPTVEALETIAPWRFAAPLSPDMAAAREGKTIDFAALVGFCQAALADPQQTVLIEGVGGAFVPLDREHSTADWIAALGIPALLISGSYLGSLSHTIATAEALRGRGVAISTILINETPGSTVDMIDTQASLMRHVPGCPIALLPRLANADGQGWRHAVNLLQLLPGEL